MPMSEDLRLIPLRFLEHSSCSGKTSIFDSLLDCIFGFSFAHGLVLVDFDGNQFVVASPSTVVFLNIDGKLARLSAELWALIKAKLRVGVMLRRSRRIEAVPSPVGRDLFDDGIPILDYIIDELAQDLLRNGHFGELLFKLFDVNPF